MSRYTRDGRDIMQDLVIAFKHPEYRDMDPLDALRDIKRRRGGGA